MRSIVLSMAVALLVALTFPCGLVAAQHEARASNPSPAPAKLDVNIASLEELIAVPGIGPATAQAILDLRGTKGSFAKLEDLLEVRGIALKKLKTLTNYLTVETPTPSPTPQAAR